MRRKLVDRINDALRLGAPAQSIHAYAVVPEQQHAGAQSELKEEVESRRLNGLPSIAEMAAWSTFDVSLAYAALTGAHAGVAIDALHLITASLA